jgi:hypothetical protein
MIDNTSVDSIITGGILDFGIEKEPENYDESKLIYFKAKNYKNDIIYINSTIKNVESLLEEFIAAKHKYNELNAKVTLAKMKVYESKDSNGDPVKLISDICEILDIKPL